MSGDLRSGLGGATRLFLRWGIMAGPKPEPLRLTVKGQEQAVPIEKLMDEIKARKAEQKTFLDLAPPEYRENISLMANKVFLEKGQGRSEEEFSEAIALNWLLKRATFEWVVRENIFRDRTLIVKAEQCQIFALTRNGSFIALSAPAPDTSAREIFYARIPGRVESKLPEVVTQNGGINKKCRVRERAEEHRFHLFRSNIAGGQ